MEIRKMEVKDILELEKEIGTTLIVDEVKVNSKIIFRAYFEDSEVTDSSQSHKLSTGDSIDMAIENYCFLISGNIIALNKSNKDREKRIKCGKIIHSKKIES